MSLLHHQLTFYIVMFKKEKFIPQMCILFYNQLWGWDGNMGGLGREGLLTLAADGNLQKKFSMPTINVLLFAIFGNYHKHGQVTLS